MRRKTVWKSSEQHPLNDVRFTLVSHGFNKDNPFLMWDKAPTLHCDFLLAPSHPISNGGNVDT